jgi:hypothetical protein
MSEDNEGVEPSITDTSGTRDIPSSRPKLDIGDLRQQLFFISEGDDEYAPPMSPSEHIHSNDAGYGRAIAEVTPTSVESSKNRVGLVIGNGAVLSTLPNMPAETAILVDRNPFIHAWTQMTAAAFLESDSPAEYIARVYSPGNALYQEAKASGEAPEEGLQRERDELREQHFLSSQERFDICKEALKEKHLLYFTADISDRNNSENLAYVLGQNNAEVTFANMTNVWDHVRFAGRSLADSLPTLPFNPHAVILHSSQGFNAAGERNVVSEGQLQRGLQNYMEAAQQSFAQWRGHK